MVPSRSCWSELDVDRFHLLDLTIPPQASKEFECDGVLKQGALMKPVLQRLSLAELLANLFTSFTTGLDNTINKSFTISKLRKPLVWKLSMSHDGVRFVWFLQVRNVLVGQLDLKSLYNGSVSTPRS